MIRMRLSPLMIVVALALLLSAGQVLAVEPDEILKDPALEARAREISRDLRCLVCRNESIDESNAPLARDLRLVVRERLTAGDTDAEVITHVRERYGDYVLLDPPVQGNTMLLWLAPLLLLVAGGGLVIHHFMRYRLGDEEEGEDPPPVK